MAADPPNSARTEHDGEDRSHAGRWIVAGVGLAWLLQGVLRRKRVPVRTVRVPVASEPQPQLRPHPARNGHETSDAHAGWIFGIVAFLFVSGLAIHFILAAYLGALNKMPPPTDQLSGSARAQNAGAGRGTFPVLQVSPPADLEGFRRREEAQLHDYGWINKTSGAVRIPIERAMDLVLKQGLPVREQTNESKVGPSSYELMLQRAKGSEPAAAAQQEREVPSTGGEQGGQGKTESHSNSNQVQNPTSSDK